MWEMTREIIRKIGKNNETQEKSCHECIVPFGHTLFYMSALSSIHMDECNAPFGDTQFLLSILNKPRHKCNTPFGDPNVCVNHVLINQPKDTVKNVGSKPVENATEKTVRHNGSKSYR